MANTQGGAAHPPLDARAADKLLDLLSTDNEFRRLFKKDPWKALAQIGYQAPPSMHGLGQTQRTADCCTASSIAPKAEIAAARDRLHQMLTSATVFTTPHCFEAGGVDKALRRK